MTVSANGPFQFSTPIAFLGSYNVTVGTQPNGQICSVTNGTGAGTIAAVTGVSVTCANNSYTVGGTLSGLASGSSVTLQDNGGDNLQLTANGSFTFPTPVAAGGSYAVTVLGQTTGQTCSVTAGSGSNVSANVNSAQVVCSPITYTIGGSVSGLTSGQQVTLTNNGADPTTVSANGSFTFATPVAYGGSYNVAVATQPTGETCSVTSGAGSNVTANVGGVAVSCTPLPTHFVYVSDGANPQIFQYGINPDGSLSPLSIPVATPAGAVFGMAITPNGSFLYATLNASNAVEAFAINADGTLAPIPGLPVTPTGTAPYQVTVSPNGKYVFVGDQGGSGSVDAYSINADGSLTTIGEYPTSGGSNVQGLVVDPTSTHLYVMGAASSTIDVMTINSDGSLTDQGASTTTGGAFATIDPTGQYLIVTGGSKADAFTITPGTGLLAPMAQFPLAGSTAAMPLFDPASHLYVGMNGSATIDQFSFTGGMVSALTPASVSAGASQSGVNGIAIDSTDQHLYTVNRGSKDISAFVIGAGGTLTPTATNPVVAVPSSPTPDPYAIVAH